MSHRQFVLLCSIVFFQALSAHAYVGGLTPSLLCSACEVTAREIYNGYVNISQNDKYAGSELELIEVLENACARIPGRYKLAQEAFGTHMKVFADETSKYDIQNVEPPEYYSKKEEKELSTAMAHLYQRCQYIIGEFEDELTQMVKDRAEEHALRKYMCIESTAVCDDETLKKFKKKEARRRKKWKKRQGKKEIEEKLAKELNDNLEEKVGIPKKDDL